MCEFLCRRVFSRLLGPSLGVGLPGRVVSVSHFGSCQTALPPSPAVYGASLALKQVDLEACGVSCLMICFRSRAGSAGWRQGGGGRRWPWREVTGYSVFRSVGCSKVALGESAQDFEGSQASTAELSPPSSTWLPRGRGGGGGGFGVTR